jgi:phosphoglycolate phosphatase
LTATSNRRILLFDIDGTLIDTGGAGGKAFLEAFGDEFGVDAPKPVPMSGRTDFGILSQLLEENGIPAAPDALNRLRRLYVDKLRGRLPKSTGRVLPGVVELLEQLKERDQFQLGLLTGNLPESAKMKLEHFALDHHFDWGIFGDQHPERGALGRYAMTPLRERFGHSVEQHELVVIGDTPLDVLCAREIGCRVLCVATGVYDIQALQAHAPVHLVENMSDTQAIIDWMAS